MLIFSSGRHKLLSMISLYLPKSSFYMIIIIISCFISEIQAGCIFDSEENTGLTRCQGNTFSSQIKSQKVILKTRQAKPTDIKPVFSNDANKNGSHNNSDAITSADLPLESKLRQRTRRSMRSLTWSFYTHVKHEFHYHVPTQYLKRCFPSAIFKLAHYNTEEYTWLRYDSINDRINGFPMEGDEGTYTLTLKWRSAKSYGANGEAKLTLHVLPNPADNLHVVRFWLEHRAFHMAEDMNERQIFVSRLVSYLTTYNVYVKIDEIMIHHIDARSGLVEWSLQPGSVGKSCTLAQKLSMILPHQDGSASADLAKEFIGFDEVLEVNVSLSETCKNYKEITLSNFQKVMPIAALFFAVIVGPVILSLAIRRCYKARHPCPKNGQEDYIFYKLAAEERCEDETEKAADNTRNNKRRTARQETDNITSFLQQSALPEKLEIERVRNSFLNHNAFSLTNDVFEKMCAKEKRQPSRTVNCQQPNCQTVNEANTRLPWYVNGDLVNVQNDISDTPSDTVSDRLWTSRNPVDELYNTQCISEHSSSTVTFTPQRPTVYIDTYNYV